MFYGLAAVSLVACFCTAFSVASAEAINVTVDRSGCAISQPNEALVLDLWRDRQYPGDGSQFPPERTIFAPWTTVFDTKPGYYRVGLASKHCWENFYPVAVVSGHSRHIRLKPWSWVREENVDYDIYTVPYGAVVGQLESGQSAPSLLRVGESGNPDSVASLEPDGFYYFDGVSVGSYILSISTRNGIVKQTVQVNEGKITVVPPL
jgi:hypothetical protein